MALSCASGIEVPARPEDPAFVWKTAKAPCWVTGCVMGVQTCMKNYPLMCPGAEVLEPFVDPILAPCLGGLEYCVIAYQIEDMKFGDKKLAFTGNCCSYYTALACVELKTMASCTIWYSCCGGIHVLPNYLDNHVCLTTEKADFKPLDRWEDAGKCKAHFAEIKKNAHDNTPFNEHMFLMQNVPSPSCSENCAAFCHGYGTKQLNMLNNELRYVRIGHRKLKFTGDADGFASVQPSCCFKLGCTTCFAAHTFMGTYRKAHRIYIDNHLAWDDHPEGLPAGTSEALTDAGGVAPPAPEKPADMSVEADSAPGVELGNAV